MEKVKMTIRIPRDLHTKAKRYAEENQTTLTDIIIANLRRVQLKEPQYTPITDRLSGVISEKTSLQDYYEHIDEKYGAKNKRVD